ncbi:TetR/AcrR family transcriptional regulator [Sphingopyxis sp.]|jgi:TetR/AcrR family transcriptional repressor of mexJK operon|uniref:TetR/AcrR family transcriptional regulator n=1 Tax=Sphingopyxis sp. TaxID=1908224 RepID=UPI002E07658E|nr:TetR/AcrR family transcriptional regulator [Sphingopyxis sp.]
MTSTQKTKKPGSGRTGRPTRQASQALSRKILRVARDVFFADGFGRSTAERIAAKAGISKRTLYARYGNKQLLFEAAILMEIEDRLSFLEQHVPEHGDVRLELEELSDELLSWMLTDIHVALERVVMAEAARFPALARNLYEFGVGRTTRLVAEVLRKAEERGEIRVSDANFAAEQFISSVILSPFRRAALGVGVTSHNETSSARMRQAADLFVYGCRPSLKGSHP